MSGRMFCRKSPRRVVFPVPGDDIVTGLDNVPGIL